MRGGNHGEIRLILIAALSCGTKNNAFRACQIG